MDNGNAKRNIETIERLFEAFRAGNTDTFDELIVDDYVQHNPQGHDGPSPPPRPLSRPLERLGAREDGRGARGNLTRAPDQVRREPVGM